MTDDEGFIRGIVDRPGDDVPRLVYADWLDERGDPRGAYLRAEHQFVARGRGEAKVKAAAIGLDPVWVARVSRPPVGVCCAHLAASKAERVVEPDELDVAEAELGVALPAQLRAVLLNYNPGRLRGGPFVAPATDHWPRIAVLEFVDLNGQDPDDDEIGVDLVERTFHMRQSHDFPDHLLYLASGSEFEHFMVSGRKSGRGAVHLIVDSDAYLDDRADGVVKFAYSVGAFLHQLQPRFYPLGDE